MDAVLTTLKAIAQSTRLRIVLLLADSELCSCELVELLQLSQPAVSQHMAVLKRAGLVEERKSGTWVYYRLAIPGLEASMNQLLRTLQQPRSLDAMGSEWAKLDKLLAEREHNCSLPADIDINFGQ